MQDSKPLERAGRATSVGVWPSPRFAELWFVVLWHTFLAVYFAQSFLEIVDEYAPVVRAQGGDLSISKHRFLLSAYIIYTTTATATAVWSIAALLLWVIGKTKTLRVWLERAVACGVLFALALLLVLWFAELEITHSMHVHILDPDMVQSAGYVLVLQRQLNLLTTGKWLPQEHMDVLHWYLVALVVLEVILYGISTVCVTVLAQKKQWRFWLWAVGAVLVAMLGSLVTFTAGARAIGPSVQRTELFNCLPFNVWVNSFVGVGDFVPLVPLVAPLAQVLDPSQNYGTARPRPYPLIDGCGTRVPGTLNSKLDVLVRRRRNIIILTEETWALNFSSPQHAPLLHGFVRSPQHRCHTTDRHFSMATVTEMAHFSSIYGLYPHHLLPFAREYVRSFPYCLLRANGYHIGYWSCSGPYQFPTNVLINGNADYHAPGSGVSADMDNTQAVAAAQAFMRSRHGDKEPFLLQVHLHNHVEGGPAERARTNDMDRRQLLSYAHSLGLLDDAVVVITNDHGARDDRFGDNWDMDKLDSPFFVCLPEAISDGLRAHSHKWPLTMPGISTHVDIMPTVLRLLDLAPTLPAEMYSDGLPLPIEEKSLKPASPLPPDRVLFGHRKLSADQ